MLLELVKDMLYEAYVRKGKLQQAMMVRNFFAEETLDKITPIGRAARRVNRKVVDRRISRKSCVQRSAYACTS